MSFKRRTKVDEKKFDEKTDNTSIYLNSSKSELDTIMDLTLPLDIRISTLESYADSQFENCADVLNRLSGIYQISGTSLFREYLYNIATESKLSPFHKLIAAESLCLADSDSKLGYTAINTICPEMMNSDQIAAPVKVIIVRLLMKCKDYKGESLNYFCQIVNNTNIDCHWRYKTVLSLENETDRYFIREVCLSFLRNRKNMTRYRILSSQYLLQRCEGFDENEVQQFLLSFARDNELDFNLRADASDVLLQLGTDENKEVGREIIMTLGMRDSIQKTLYDNAQNVHINEIEESVVEGIEFLSQFPTMRVGENEIGIGNIEKKIEDYIVENKVCKEEENSIKLSLNRISVDRALYSQFNCTILHILIKVWSYIFNPDNDHANEMFARLIEELKEMSGTCSTGFASRLINSISGFGAFNLRISWRDQIISNFTGRLNARARLIKDENLQEKVLEEMMLNSGEYADRSNFLTFFGENMLSIREEMYEEFKDHIEDTEFDLYFRSAIANYEGLRNFV